MIIFVTFRTRKESVLHSNSFNIILEVSATIIKQTKRKKTEKCESVYTLEDKIAKTEKKIIRNSPKNEKYTTGNNE
jgi:hypothetical protein